MAGGKSIFGVRFNRQNNVIKSESGNHKAAKISGTSLADKYAIGEERWTHVLQTYSDYFIRY